MPRSAPHDIDRNAVHCELGAVSVEIAFVFPILILVLFAGFEFARLNMVRHSADIAAYEASRHVVVPGATAAEATAMANRILALVGTRGAVVTINPAVIDEDVDEVNVTIEIPLDQNGWILPGLTQGRFVTASTTLRTERSRPGQ